MSTSDVLRPCPGTHEHGCGAELAGTPKHRQRCLECSNEFANDRRRARRAGIPFDVPKNQLELPIQFGEPAEQGRFA